MPRWHIALWDTLCEFDKFHAGNFPGSRKPPGRLSYTAGCAAVHILAKSEQCSMWFLQMTTVCGLPKHDFLELILLSITLHTCDSLPTCSMSTPSTLCQFASLLKCTEIVPLLFNSKDETCMFSKRATVFHFSSVYPKGDFYTLF